MATAAPGAAAGQGEVSVSVRVHEHVAYATMEGDGTLPWGTSCSEHRINPPLLRSVNAALGTATAAAVAAPVAAQVPRYVHARRREASLPVPPACQYHS